MGFSGVGHQSRIDPHRALDRREPQRSVLRLQPCGVGARRALQALQALGLAVSDAFDRRTPPRRERLEHLLAQAENAAVRANPQIPEAVLENLRNHVVVQPLPRRERVEPPVLHARQSAAAAADRQKTADDWKDKLDKQREKIDSLNRELDLEQREYRLRAAAMYSDAGNRLRNAAQWDKDDTQYKSDVEGKQKALDAARQELDDMQEQARKAGIVQRDKDKDSVPEKSKQ